MSELDKRRADVVTSVFPGAVCLADFCTSVVDTSSGEDSRVVLSTDSDAYKDLLLTTLIIPPSDNNGTSKKFRLDGKDKFPIQDIVGRLVGQFVRSNHSYQDLNCLAFGYRVKSSNSDATMRTNNDTELYFVNTMQSLVKTQTWQLLANRIGEELLRHILSQPVFVKSKNSCFLQVSGTPASELVYKDSKRQRRDGDTALLDNPLYSASAKLRARNASQLVPTQLNDSESGALDALLTAEYQKPIDLLSPSASIPRFRMFYNSRYVKNVGLPAGHVLHKRKEKVDEFVSTQFLTALSLLDRPAALASATALCDLFHCIRSQYNQCPLAQLLEKHCSLGSVFRQAEPLMSVKVAEAGAESDEEKGTAEVAVDVSALFATPASKGSMQLGGAFFAQDGDSSSKKSVVVHSQGLTSSTWHSSTGSDVKMTLTSSTEKAHTANSNHTVAESALSPAGTLVGLPPPLNAAEDGNSSVAEGVEKKRMNSNKRKRGCRAGKLTKQTKRAGGNSVGKSKQNTAAQADRTQNNTSNSAPVARRTLTQEIQTSIDKLLEKHSERPLITVGESIVNRTLQSVRMDRRVQELGVGTQDIPNTLPSLQSRTLATPRSQPIDSTPSAALQPEPTAQAAAQPAEESETYASVVSAANRHSQDRKRKYVSIQESANSMSPSPPSNEFQYFVPSGTTPGSLPATGSSSKSSKRRASLDNRTQAQEPQHTVPVPIPPCPEQLGGVNLRDFSRAKRKKLKFKFRALFEGTLKKSVPPGTPVEASGQHRSPVLPDSVESGLLHHLTRPFLTEAHGADRGAKRTGSDPRSELFPPSADSPAHTVLASQDQTIKSLRTDKLDRLVQESDLLSLSTPVEGVAEFVKAVCRSVLPTEAVLGTRRNANAFMSTLDAYVKLGRQETLTLALVVKGISVSDIPWLKVEDKYQGDHKVEELEVQLPQVEPMIQEHTQCSEAEDDAVELSPLADQPAQQDRPSHAISMGVSRAASAAQTQLFLAFMHWLYSDFVNSLIAACFYATEVEGRGAEVLFYRKPLWARIVHKGKMQLFNNFVPLICSEESHLAVQTSLVRPPSAAGALPSVASVPSISRTSTAQPGDTAVPSVLQRSSSLPPPNPAVPLRTQSGSVLFNDVLRSNKYPVPVPSLAEENNSIITNLPLSRTSTAVNKVSQSFRLKNFLLRLPVVRFVPKKSSVRAITNLRSKRTNGGTYANSGGGGAFTTSSGQQIGEVLTNSALYNCLHVLKSVYASNPALAGFGAFGLDDIYLKLLKYKDNIAPAAETGLSKGTTPPQGLQKHGEEPGATTTTEPKEGFFVAVLDLEKCYDNVDPTKLYDLLKRIFIEKDGASAPPAKPSNEARSALSPVRTTSTPSKTAAATAALSFENVIHKYAVTHPMKSMDRNISKNVRFVAAGGGEIVPFRAASEELAHCYPYSILTDAVVYPKITHKEVLRLLKIHLFQHAVKIAPSSTKRDGTADNAEAPHQYFTQVKGIPQGSVLSPLLCTLYYGNAESNIFGTREAIELIGLADKTVVIRLMDDYIVISTEQQCVQHFLQLAHQSLKAYGAGVNPLKTKVNFPASVDVDGENIPLQRIEGDEMPWCGLLLNTRTLEVTCHFARILERPLSSSVLAEFAKSGAAFRRAVKTFMRMKCHAIVLDAQLNSKLTVVSTLYTMYLVVAMRTHAYLKHLRQVTGTPANAAHIYRCIAEGITFGARLIYTRTVRKSCRKLHLGSSAEFDGGGAVDCEEGDDNSRSGVDARLFADCVEAVEPECFGSCAVSFQEASWLGLQAFVAALGRRRALYSAIIKTLCDHQAQFTTAAQRGLFAMPGCQDRLQQCDGILDTAQWL